MFGKIAIFILVLRYEAIINLLITTRKSLQICLMYSSIGILISVYLSK